MKTPGLFFFTPELFMDDKTFCHDHRFDIGGCAIEMFMAIIKR